MAPFIPFFPRYTVPATPLFMRYFVAFLVLGAIYCAAFFSPHNTGTTLLSSALSLLLVSSVDSVSDSAGIINLFSFNRLATSL